MAAQFVPAGEEDEFYSCLELLFFFKLPLKSNITLNT